MSDRRDEWEEARDRKRDTWVAEVRRRGLKPGPFGCLCRDFVHHMVGDGCEVCQPDNLPAPDD